MRSRAGAVLSHDTSKELWLDESPTRTSSPAPTRGGRSLCDMAICVCEL
jgi:hypothetical protein